MNAGESMIQTILRERSYFNTAHPYEATSVYLGKSEHEKLKMDAYFACGFHTSKAQRMQVGGLLVYLVDADSHFKIT